jgi:hypothetical protein
MSRTLKVSSSAVAKPSSAMMKLTHKERHRNGRPRVTSAAGDTFIRVNSLRNCNPNKCFTEFK